MWNRAKSLSLIIIFIFSFVSCSHQVIIDTKPKSASVRINGEEQGRTPVFFNETTGNGKDYTLLIEKEGYKPISKVIKQTQWNDGCLVGSVGGGIACILPFLGLIWSRQLNDSYFFELEAEKTETSN